MSISTFVNPCVACNALTQQYPVRVEHESTCNMLNGIKVMLGFHFLDNYGLNKEQTVP